MTIRVFKKYTSRVMTALTLVMAVSCLDTDFEEFEAPTGNVNNIQPNTLFTTSTNPDNTLSIVFRGFSTDAKSYAWDFGDATGTSEEQNVEYEYATGGLYQVKLTTISSDGLVAIDSSYVSPVFVDFNTNSVDTEVTFDNLTSGAAAITWDFGDGEVLEWLADDTEEDEDFSPTHTYTSADTFTATITVTDFLGEQVSVRKNIEGLVLSTIPDFTFSTDGLEVTFTDASTLAVAYLWDFGDGSATTTEQNPVHTYAENGAYPVTLTTTNEAGVSKSITLEVPVGGVPASFAAVIQNGDMETYPTTENNNNDLVDAWTIDPDNTNNDGSSSLFNFWRNDDLELWVSTSANTGGSTDKMSSSGTDAQSAGGTSGRSLKFDSGGERAYQPFEVETGVEYTITAFARTDGASGLTGTFYILSGEPASEEAGVLDALALAKYELTSSGAGSWDQAAFGFTADATFTFSQDRVDESTEDILISTDQKFVIFYFVPNAASGTENVFLTDVVINTPSL